MTSDHPISLTFPLDEETSCAKNSSLIIYEVKEPQQEELPSDNETLQTHLMVMSGSHYSIISLSSKEMKKETLYKIEESCRVPEKMTAT